MPHKVCLGAAIEVSGREYLQGRHLSLSRVTPPKVAENHDHMVVSQAVGGGAAWHCPIIWEPQYPCGPHKKNNEAAASPKSVAKAPSSPVVHTQAQQLQYNKPLGYSNWEVHQEMF